MDARTRSKIAHEERQAWTFVGLFGAVAAIGIVWQVSAATACDNGSLADDFNNGWVRTPIENTLWNEKELAYKFFESYDIHTGCYIGDVIEFPLMPTGQRR